VPPLGDTETARLRSDLATFRDEIRAISIGIVYGARSREDAFYIANSPPELLTVTHVCETFEDLGLSFRVIDPCGEHCVAELQDCDAVFIVSHGEYGEDGRLQGLLDYLGKPYIGSGVAAGAIGNDKVLCKLALRGAGIRTPDYVALDSEDSETSARRIEAAIPPPWIAKPVACGSSIGISVAHSPETLRALLAHLPTPGEMPYFIEPFLHGKVITVAILEAEPGDPVALTPVEVRQDAEFYDEETKLDRGLAAPRYSEPTDLSAETYDRVERVALEAYSVLGCRGFARVDVLVSEETPFVLEINTIPGLSKRSNFMAAARRSGLSSEEVVLAVLRSALARPRDE
jgi:D-alanine-D-alanine ligase